MDSNQTVFDRTPDVEVMFRFNGTRKYPAANGYRPAHRLSAECVMGGVHRYEDVPSVPADGTVKGSITSFLPEACPRRLYEGKEFDICEGERVVGQAVVLKVLNPILEVV